MSESHKFILFLTGILLLVACGKKNQQIDYNVGVLASQEYVQSQQMMDMLLNTYFKSITDSILIADYASTIDGAVVTYHADPEETIVIEYPDWDSPDGYGHLRSGTMTAVANPGFYDSLAVINFTIDQFRYDGDTVIVSGMTVTNKGREGADMTYAVKALSVLRIYADTTGGGTSFGMDQTFIRIKDSSTIYYSPEDEFKVFGNIHGVSSTGYSYETQILGGEEFLLDQFSCPYAKRGPATLSMESQVYSAFILFPGADTCVNKYAVDIEGLSFFFPFE